MENADFYTELFGYDEDEDGDVPARLKNGEFVTIHFLEYGTLACIPLSEYHALVATAQLATEYRAQVDILKETVETMMVHYETSYCPRVKQPPVFKIIAA